MKRGVSNHLDWVIAFGIFFVAITLIIIGLKPGVTPTHEPDVLVKIIEDNFHDDFNWNLYELPIKITSHGSTVRCQDFPFTDWKTSELYKRVGDELVSVDFSVGSDLIVATPNSLETNDYVMLFGEGLSGGSGLSCPCDSCEAIYGVPYELEGISCDKLNSLPDYETIKNNWNYPNTREFSLYMDGGCGNIVINDIEPPLNTPVYVRTINDYILYSNGERQIVDITIKVW